MNLAFWSDGPPLTGNAPGNHGIARHVIEGLRDSLACVITHRYHRSHSPADIRSAGGGVPVWLYPDSRRLGLRRISSLLAALVDLLLFLLALPRLMTRLHRARVERVFVLCGADLWFPLQVWIFRRISRIPVDVYLVDDIEESARRGPDARHLDLGFRILSAMLRASDRVFAISPGFAEHLGPRFGVAVQWLPVPASIPPPEYTPPPTDRKQLHLTFVGALNFLYLDALRDLHGEISRRNASTAGPPMVLELLTYSNPEAFLASLPDREWVEVHENLPEEERMRRLKRAHACFLPYSFLENERLMVATSFSCKILEYFQCGRPILVYGPAYASIPRYFREQQLHFLATRREELGATLEAIADGDNPALIGAYREAWQRHHSAAALRRILLTPDSA